MDVGVCWDWLLAVATEDVEGSDANDEGFPVSRALVEDVDVAVSWDSLSATELESEGQEDSCLLTLTAAVADDEGREDSGLPAVTDTATDEA